eukprot:3711851-Pyramimonas_sp.AAC.1
MGSKGFYDTMDHCIPWKRGKRSMCPMRVLIHSINMHRWPRRVQLSGGRSARVFSEGGVAAGSGPATCEAKAPPPRRG